MLWRIWYSKSKLYNWVVQSDDGKTTYRVNHVNIRVFSETEETDRTGSAPPPFVILAKGVLKFDNGVATIELERKDSCV